MNRRIAKWIQIGLFAALPVGFTAVAAAQDAPSDTHAPGTMAPGDTNSLDQNKIDQQKSDTSKMKTNQDIEKTRGGSSSDTGSTKTEETTTTSKKKKTHKTSSDANKMDDTDKMNDSKMKSKSTPDEDINNPPSDSNMQNPNRDLTK